MTSKRRQAAGFTLFEVLVTLTIATLVMTLALPFFGPLMTRPKLDAASFRILTLFEVERTAAWRSGVPTIIDFSSNFREIIVRRTGAVFRLPDAVKLVTSPASSCSSLDTMVTFYPDGRACAPRIQVSIDRLSNEIDTNAMTGGLQLVR